MDNGYGLAWRSHDGGRMLTHDSVRAKTVIELRVLGNPQVTRDGVDVTLQRKQLAVLTYLTLADAGRIVKRDTLLGVFWPECDQTKARGALRQPLYNLRRELGDEVIVSHGDDDVTVNHDLVHCDAFAFGGARVLTGRKS